MNPQNISRLKQEQEKALDETNANIKQWENFRSDYKHLKSRLKTLPDKVTHDVMVPFGKLAFMPGKLVHTNEILVLLGDNWFVERSAKQACEIIDRRIKSVNKEIEALQKQKELLQPRVDAVTNQLSEQPGTFEITEEYDEEKEKVWREQHRKNVQSYRKSLKEEPTETKKPMTDEELWERLDQLEKVESERREMHKMTSDEILLHKSYDSDDSILSIESGSDSGDQDTGDVEGQEASSEGEESDDEESEFGGHTRVIKFTHTRKQNYSKNSGTESGTDTDDVKIKSPADIFSQFSGPKSILKDSREQVIVKKHVRLKEELESTSTDSVEAKPKPVAFSESVVERKTDLKTTNEKAAESTHDQPVRMSRFKARRQGLDQV